MGRLNTRREGVVVAFVLAACAFESSTGAGGAPAATAGSSSSSDGATASGTSAPMDPTAGSASATGSADGTTAVTTATGGDPTSDTGPARDTEADPALAAQDAVVVQYFLDEAATGEPAGLLLDSGPDPPMNLEPTYDGSQMQPAYVEDAGHRGLRWNVHGAGGRGQAAVAGSKLANLDGATEATLEFVIDMTSVFMTEEPWARLMVWQPDIVPYAIELGVLGAWDNGAFAIDLRAAWQPGGGLPVARWSLADSPGRIVVHIVIDTTDPPESPLRMFVDGTEVVPTLMTPPPNGTPLVATDSAFLVLGNRPADNASFGGTVYYAAVYDRALSDADVANNAGILDLDDDSP